ncbi:MAG: tetratricopeptide repeat protein [Candidatus Obscuribacter sp.]|nr:tetratricopeptide repeat protein [Candidatus Obscuribacter sp.]
MKLSRVKQCSLLAASLTLALGLAPILAQSAIAMTLADADQLLLQNKLKQAEEAYRALLGEDESGDAVAGLAVTLAKQSWPAKILEAEKLLKEARAKFPDNPNVISAASYVTYVHSKTVASPAKRDLYLEAAESLAKKAINQNPDIVIANQTLGMVKIAQDDIEGAVAPLRRACNIAENSVNLTLLAQALLRLDNKDKEAEGLVNKALQLKNDYGPARLQHAIILEGQGKNEDAYMELKNIALDQRGSDWHAVAGNILEHQGDGPSALQSWSQAIQLDPRNPEPYKKKAQHYQMRGDGALAIAEYHTGLDILPNDTEMRLELAELALRQDNLDVAETEFKIILEAKPDDARAMLGLARVGFRKYRKEGSFPPNFNQLMEKLQNVISEQSVQGKVVKEGTRSLNENIQLSEATKAASQNQFHEAHKSFMGVIESHREDPYELITLAEQCYFEGDYKAAVNAFNYAKELPEVSTRAEQGLGKIQTQRNEAKRHVKLGDSAWKIPEIAVDHYKQGLNADPQCADAFYGLYSLFTKSDKQDPAQASSYGQLFLEASEDSDPRRKEVEANLSKLKKRLPGGKGK